MTNLTLMAIPITSTTTPNSLIEHFDIMWLVVLAAIGIIVWFATKTFNKFERNQDALFDRIRTIENSLSHLLGEHETNCNRVIPILAELTDVLREVNANAIERNKK